jgi:hypothetical protein
MDSNQHIWRVWAENAHRWGLSNWAASLLEAAGPLSLVGAQAIYLTQPVLSSFLPENQVNALAQLLEEPALVRSFAAMLREDSLP